MAQAQRAMSPEAGPAQRWSLRQVWRSRLYVRIWCAMLAALAFAVFLVAMAWGVLGPDWSESEIALYDEAGRPAGTARISHPARPHGKVTEVRLPDGRVYSARWEHPDGSPPWPLRFVVTLGLIVTAVGVAAFPVARRLTHRLDLLARGADAWGEGQLGTRVAVKGCDEIAALGERLNRAAERVEQLLRSQKSLLANASHELRSPLARIRMGLSLICEERGDGTRAELERSIEELDELIEEILLASRLDALNSSAEPHEEVDLTGLLAEECARADAELEAEHVVLSGSPKLLRRLVRNLLENGRRHAGDAPVVATLKPEGGQAVLRVCDRGPGVPEEQRERIFEPFYRLPGASERSGGVGLGLALVRAIARSHGGEVRCEPYEGGGACFRVVLPMDGA